ncbi:hypothetical protein ERHA54_45410 [Erwinia rhapontici]|uniref:VENN motif-containing domain-containing protein n=1 Tax=Erwinia rhapontici TaxID=55212 RepID=A0ABM7N670_ERWRD|nr:VENN motif pre-toxin domain-containing protein [Erwinia rhapontici]BCQ36930.1 hypothetical protein ERHA53_42730 [Erwinia rhapontici]BCQ41938.1 hypothetical protein ERHA54_45410 [Erwinia rhapontici]BCQ47274.1 hypothetical protein ERHA55_48010 [Erwinia rhapontici]
MGSITDADRDQAQKDWVKAHPGQTPDESAINGQVYQNFYDQAFNATGLGTGGAVQQGIQAATAVVQGLAGGDIAAAIANGSAPYLAEAIGHRMGIDNNPEAKAVAHAIVGAALAAAQGQNAAAGATGAALGEITAGILKDQLYGDTPAADLTETQKQTLSALATLSSGLAGGLAGDSTGSAVYAAQAGKTTVENNALSLPTGLMNYGQAVASWDQYAQDNNLTPEQKQAGLDKLAQGDLPAGQNAATGLITAWGAGMSTVVAPVLLPSGATAGSILAGGVISGTANVSNQIAGGGPVSITDALIAAGSGAVTQGKGFWFTEGVSVTGAYGGATLQGKDPIPAVAGAAIGTAVGAGGGKAVEIGNKYFPIVSDKTAGIAGAIGGSVASEASGSQVESKLKDEGDKK